MRIRSFPEITCAAFARGSAAPPARAASHMLSHDCAVALGGKKMVNHSAIDINEIKVYGTPAETGRWVFVLAGMIMNLCLGTVYAWSVFRKPLQDFFSTSEVKVTATKTLLPFVVFLAVFTVLMPISGRLLQRGIIPDCSALSVACLWLRAGYCRDMCRISTTCI